MVRRAVKSPPEWTRLLPKGFTCECGKEHVFPPYVFAHWNDLLTFKCACGTTHTMVRGHAVTGLFKV